MTANKIGPKDFDPYRDQFTGCNCLLCRELAYANSGHGDLYKAGEALLDALRAGTHVHVTLAERIVEAKAEKAADVAAACAAGRSELHMLGLFRGYHGGTNERFYYGEPHSEAFMVGTGIGMTPGRHEAAYARLQETRRRFMARREVEVQRLILVDGRNTCTYFRMSGEVCTHHAAVLAAA